MSGVLGDLARVRSAYDKPTVRLLTRSRAPLTLAIFASHFASERPRVLAERLHVQVEETLEELRLHGEDVPAGTARELCREWVAQQWMTLTPLADGQEEYALTSHAQEALEVVAQLSRDRAVFGESRILTILDAARRCATVATPDAEERARRLQEQIDRLSAERDRILAGEEDLVGSDERVLDQYRNLHGLLAALPGDFARVSEAVKQMHRAVLGDFRAETRRSGDILDDYLERLERLMGESPQGRAFTGAVELLRDEELLGELRADITTILQHSFATTALSATERLQLRRTVSLLREGIETVLAERRQLSTTLRRYMGRHDPLRDRELDEALRAAQQELAGWMETAGPRARVELDLGPAPLAVTHLRERLYDPRDHEAPPPLDPDDPVSEDGASALAGELEALRQHGGPDLASLRRAVLSGLSQQPAPQGGEDRVAAVSTAEVFAALPQRLRRPVELLGLLHLASQAPASGGRDAGAARFESVRPDGRRRTFRAPSLTITADDVAEWVAEWAAESDDRGDAVQQNPGEDSTR